MPWRSRGGGLVQRQTTPKNHIARARPSLYIIVELASNREHAGQDATSLQIVSQKSAAYESYAFGRSRNTCESGLPVFNRASPVGERQTFCRELSVSIGSYATRQGKLPSLTVLTQAARDDLEKNLTSVRHERVPSVVTIGHLFLLRVDHYDGVILSFLRHCTPLPMSTMMSWKLPSPPSTPSRSFSSSTGNSSELTAFPFAIYFTVSSVSSIEHAPHPLVYESCRKVVDNQGVGIISAQQGVELLYSPLVNELHIS